MHSAAPCWGAQQQEPTQPGVQSTEGSVHTALCLPNRSAWGISGQLHTKPCTCLRCCGARTHAGLQLATHARPAHTPTACTRVHSHTPWHSACTHLHARACVCTPCKHTCAHGCILQARCTASATHSSPGALGLLRAPSGPPALSQGLGSMGGRPCRGSEPWETLAAGLGEAAECCRSRAKQTSSSRRTAKLARTHRGAPWPNPPAPHHVPVPRTLGLTQPSAHHVAHSTTPMGVHAPPAAPPNPKPRAPHSNGASALRARGNPNTPEPHPGVPPSPWGGRAGCRGGLAGSPLQL